MFLSDKIPCFCLKEFIPVMEKDGWWCFPEKRVGYHSHCVRMIGEQIRRYLKVALKCVCVIPRL